MDLRSLITKMDKIEGKKILAESATTKVKEDDRKYKNRPKVKEVSCDKKMEGSSSSIADSLLESFGLHEAELTPAQQQKLGGAQAQDPYIIARNLGKDAVPVSYFKDPADQQLARQIGFKDTVPSTTPAAGASADNNMYATKNVSPEQAAGMRAANAAASNAIAPASGAGGQASTARQASTAGQGSGSDIKSIQQQLINLGINVGKTGADGKLGPNTAAGIKTFEKMAGLPETGKVSPELVQALSKGQQIVSQNGLTVAITALEKILTKYKVESVTSPSDIDIMTESEVRAYVMKNLHLVSENEKMAVMREVLSEQVPATVQNPSSGALIARNPPKFMGNADVVGGAPAQSSKLAQFGKNLAGKTLGVGAGAKGVLKASAKLGSRLIPGIGWGLLAWDVISSALDTLTSDPSVQLDPADRAEIEKHMPTLKKYLEDPAAASALPAELQQRLSSVSSRIQKLAKVPTASTTSQTPPAGASGQPASSAAQVGTSVGTAIKAPFRAVGNAIGSGATAVKDFAKGVWNAE